MKLKQGKLLISHPFLKDPNFARTVVFICENDANGNLGFVLNRLHTKKLGDLIELNIDYKFPVYYGGPVQIDTLHFLHQRPDLIDDGEQVGDNIFWGGNYEQVFILLKNKSLTNNDIRFYIGYSGWETGQLDTEVDEKSWIIHNATNNFVFYNNAHNLWKEVLKDKGGEYKTMIHFPLDPQYN